MVYTGATEERRRSTVAGKSSSSAAMNSERGAAKPLHNFNFAWDLKWGSQRHLRCMKVESDADNGGEPFDHHRRSRLESSSSRRRESEFGRARRRQQPRIGVEAEYDDDEEEEEEEGIDAVREKLMNEFKTAADKMKDAIFRGGEERPQQQQQQQPAAAVDAVMTEAAAAEEDEEEGHVVEGGSSAAAGSPSAAAAAAAALRPWNLRTRRAACKAPPPISKGLRIEEKKAAYSPLRNDGGGGTSNVGAKSPRLMRGASGSGQPEKERPKFSLTLSKKEIEEDFIKMLGHRPPRRPKRRPRAVQRQLDSLFPGSWLTEVSADSYKVPEFPENVKR